jgi:hypothetical protein
MILNYAVSDEKWALLISKIYLNYEFLYRGLLGVDLVHLRFAYGNPRYPLVPTVFPRKKLSEYYSNSSAKSQ